jgi:hypothetical protein
LAEDRFLQDLIDAEYQAEDEMDEDSEGEAGFRMAEDRKVQAGRRALAKSRPRGERASTTDSREQDGGSRPKNDHSATHFTNHSKTHSAILSRLSRSKVRLSKAASDTAIDQV